MSKTILLRKGFSGLVETVETITGNTTTTQETPIENYALFFNRCLELTRQYGEPKVITTNYTLKYKWQVTV